MGYLLIDARACGGEKQEFDTVACVHCGAAIKIVIRGLATAADYETKFRCSRCNGPICRACQERVDEAGGACTGNIKAKIDHAIKTGQWDDRRRYRYRILPN
ncbi:MAG: hypothetical protein KY476_00675 [Planctomycetes bacterium]|nr:hypothetical protein [Planctomycetota bacterium]